MSLELDPGSTLEPDGTTDSVIVLGNLVDNAVDAVPSGGTVRVSIRQDRGVTTLEVGDDGPGVSGPDRERIFVTGWSTKTAATRSSRGIGLALVSQVATRRGGAVVIDDEPDGGARFTVTLPAPRLSATRSGPAVMAHGD